MLVFRSLYLNAQALNQRYGRRKDQKQGNKVCILKSIPHPVMNKHLPKKGDTAGNQPQYQILNAADPYKQFRKTLIQFFRLLLPLIINPVNPRCEHAGYRSWDQHVIMIQAEPDRINCHFRSSPESSQEGFVNIPVDLINDNIQRNESGITQKALQQSFFKWAEQKPLLQAVCSIEQIEQICQERHH